MGLYNIWSNHKQYVKPIKTNKKCGIKERKKNTNLSVKIIPRQKLHIHRITIHLIVTFLSLLLFLPFILSIDYSKKQWRSFLLVFTIFFFFSFSGRLCAKNRTPSQRREREWAKSYFLFPSLFLEKWGNIDHEEKRGEQDEKNVKSKDLGFGPVGFGPNLFMPGCSC